DLFATEFGEYGQRPRPLPARPPLPDLPEQRKIQPGVAKERAISDAKALRALAEAHAPHDPEQHQG
ncbi:hypothetical protein ABZ372_53455, partial [Streptomyces sp. NPDC005921]